MNQQENPQEFLFIIMIFEKAGKKVSKNQKNLDFTGSSTADVYTVKKNGIIKPESISKRPLSKSALICPFSASGKNFNPRNT